MSGMYLGHQNAFLDIQVPAIVSAFILAYEVRAEWFVDVVRDKLTLEIYNKITGSTTVHIYKNRGSDNPYGFQRFISEIAKSGAYRSKEESKLLADITGKAKKQQTLFAKKRKHKLGIPTKRRYK